MIKPVFIYNGFIDSGKTSAIIASLNDNYLKNSNQKLLIISLEEGEISIDEHLNDKAQIVHFKYQDLTIDKMQELENNYQFSSVIIEFNGMDNILEFIDRGFCSNWVLADIICFINCETFSVFLNNLKQNIYNQVKCASVVVFNRYTNQDKKYLRTSVKSINPKTTIVYEDIDRNITPEAAENIFDLSSEHLEISDNDFGMWYIDAASDPIKYENKKITLKLKLVEDLKEYPRAMLFGRDAMVCCAADIAPLTITCLGVDKSLVRNQQYYYLTGYIHLLNDTNNQKTCVLYVDELLEAQKPSEELVTFN